MITRPASRRRKAVHVRACTALMESVEARRLMATNLVANPDATQIPTVVLPNQTFQVPVNITNSGTTDASQTFAVSAHLVPVTIPQWFANSTMFDGAGAINVGSGTHSGPVAAGSEIELVSVNATVPLNITPGLYALVVKVDIGNAVAESSDADNEAISNPVMVLSSGGIMSLAGTTSADVITMVPKTISGKPAVDFRTDAGSLPFRIGAVTGFDVSLLGGDDVFVVAGNFNGLYVDGGDGNDRIAGGDGNETLGGGAGKDSLDGAGGNDRVNGNGGNDKLSGGAGADRLYGYDGNDFLDGGSSNDRLEGGGGLDTLFGQSGNDRFFCADGENDQLFGASGSDTATADTADILSSIENQTLA